MNIKHFISVDEFPTGKNINLLKQKKKPFTAGEEIVFEHEKTGEQKTAKISKVETNDKALKQDWRLVTFEVEEVEAEGMLTLDDII